MTFVVVPTFCGKIKTFGTTCIIPCPGNFTGEAKIDITRLRNENVISVYMHENPVTNHEATPLRVIDFGFMK